MTRWLYTRWLLLVDGKWTEQDSRTALLEWRFYRRDRRRGVDT